MYIFLTFGENNSIINIERRLISMNLFKQKTMAMANSLDWNCKCCKRAKNDTRRIHKNARRKLQRYDMQLIKEWKECGE